MKKLYVVTSEWKNGNDRIIECVKSSLQKAKKYVKEAENYNVAFTFSIETIDCI